MPHKLIQGLKEIAEHLGFQLQQADSRRVLRSWIEREGLPARLLAGRWYADAAELEQWWNERLAGRARSASRTSSPGLPKIISAGRISAPGGARGAVGLISSPGRALSTNDKPASDHRTDGNDSDGRNAGWFASGRR